MTNKRATAKQVLAPCDKVQGRSGSSVSGLAEIGDCRPDHDRASHTAERGISVRTAPVGWGHRGIDDITGWRVFSQDWSRWTPGDPTPTLKYEEFTADKRHEAEAFHRLQKDLGALSNILPKYDSPATRSTKRLRRQLNALTDLPIMRKRLTR